MSHKIRWQFVAENDIGSRAISWFSAGHLSHVDCVVDGDWHNGLEGCLLGARDDHVGGQLPGVRFRPPNYARFTRRVIMEIRCTPVQKHSFIRFMGDQLEKPYDEEAILAFLFNRDWRKPDSWICSELQAAACEAAGIVPALYLAANKITPVACALALSAAGAVHLPHTQEKIR